MKRIGLVFREKIIEEIKERVQDTKGCFFVGFNKVKASPYNCLRNDLHKVGSKVLVTKNSLLKRAFTDLGWQDLDGFLEGETGIVFVYDKDIVGACKIMVNFSKEREVLQIKGGFLGGEKVDSKQVAALAKLPSKEILLGMAVRGMASPLTGFVGALNQIILKFVWVVQEIKNKKG
ncbi:MAG: 50S ribosomal protein L10 [Candidatus Omnitrophota bacterium]|nr:MAG: 50S ribosomal protein L10 [Candidatus Omnitrophota bacterium]